MDNFTDVSITSNFIQDLSVPKVLYLFRVKYILNDFTPIYNTDLSPIVLNKLTNELTCELGYINENVNSIELLYGYSKDDCNNVGISFRVNSTIYSDVDTSITLDLSDYIINAELRSVFGTNNIGIPQVNGSLYITEHYHMTGSNTDQYDPYKLVDELRKTIDNKLNKIQSEDSGLSISDLAGFYNNLDNLLEFVSDDTKEFIELNLEDIYIMNDYKINLLGKDVPALTDVSPDKLNGLVVTSPTATNRELKYIDLPSYLLYFRNSIGNAKSFNELKTTSIYNLNAANLTDGPTSAPYTGFLQVQELSTVGNYYQHLYLYKTPSLERKEYYRYITNDSITEWTSIIDSNNIEKYVTFDLVVESQDELNRYISSPNSYKNVAFVNGNYNLSSLRNIQSNLYGFDATLTITTLSSTSNSSLTNLKFSVSNTSSGSKNIFTGFKGIQNCEVTLISSAASSTTLFKNCSNLNGVSIDSSNAAGSIIHFDSCRYLNNCTELTDSNKMSYRSSTMIDPYTCDNVVPDSTKLGGVTYDKYYVSSSSSAGINFDTFNNLGITYVSGNSTNGPESDINNFIIEVIKGNDSLVTQRVYTSTGYLYKRFRIGTGPYSDWSCVVTEDNSAKEYKILSSKSIISKPIHVTNFNSIQLNSSMSISESIGFYSESNATNSPFPASNAYGKIYKTTSGYNLLASNGVELALGKFNGSTVDWRYVIGGTSSNPYTNGILSRSSTLSKSLNSALVLIQSGTDTYYKIQLPKWTDNISIGLKISIMNVSSSPSVIDIFMSGKLGSAEWSNCYADLNSSSEVTNIYAGKSDNKPVIYLRYKSTIPESLVSIDFVCSDFNSLSLNDINVSTSSSSSGATEITINTKSSTYNVTNQINSRPISDYFNGTTANSSNKINVTSSSDSVIYLAGTSSNSSGSQDLLIRSDVSVNSSGRINVQSVNATSALSKKENIKPFDDDALDILSNTEIVKFNFKNDENKEEKVGFIADYTNEYLSTKNHDSMDYGSCIGVLIKAIQELQAEVNDLKSRG